MRGNRPTGQHEQLPFPVEGFAGEQLLLTDAAAAAENLLLTGYNDHAASSPADTASRNGATAVHYNEPADLVQIGSEAGVLSRHLPRFVLENHNGSAPYKPFPAEDHPDEHPTLQRVHDEAARRQRRRTQ
jgi:hypothetical protein